MKLTRKDLIATLLIAAVVVPYVGYLIWGEMPFIPGPCTRRLACFTSDPGRR